MAKNLKTRAYSDEQIDYIKKALATNNEIVKVILKGLACSSFQMNLDAMERVISDKNATCVRILDTGYDYVSRV